MAQNEEPTFDLDALQAQINMAMAETEELVSSWVQPSKNTSKRPKQSFEDMEKELQDYLRRPPRLGVGAPIPESIGPNAQEEAKLKGKLVGHGKKRGRENELVKEPDEEDEEDDERKGESSTKRVRLDPFSIPKKKAKHKESGEKAEEKVDVSAKQKDDDSMTVLADDNVTTNGVITVRDEPAQAEVVAPASPSPQTATDVPASPTSAKKKKKKKKRKLGEPNGTTDRVSGPPVINGSIVDLIPDAKSPTTVTGDEDEEEEWTGFGDLVLDSVDVDYSMDEGDAASEIKSNGISLKIEPGSSRAGAPLLNLNGPSHSDNDDAMQSPSSKKKRRRRKKDKLHGLENNS